MTVLSQEDRERLCDRFDAIKGELITAVVGRDWSTGVPLALEALDILEDFDAIATMPSQVNAILPQIGMLASLGIAHDDKDAQRLLDRVNAIKARIAPMH